MAIRGIPPKNVFDLKNKLVDLPSIKYGTVAEWLGRGLQNLVQRFESARCLCKKRLKNFRRFFIGLPNQINSF